MPHGLGIAVGTFCGTEEAAMIFDRRVKKLDVWDVGLIVLSVAFAVLATIGFSPTIAEWVLAQNPWLFLFIAVILAARPMYSFWLS
jgi:hypothetical protein